MTKLILLYLEFIFSVIESDTDVNPRHIDVGYNSGCHNYHWESIASSTVRNAVQLGRREDSIAEFIQIF